jgi:hypothetical protein
MIIIDQFETSFGFAVAGILIGVCVFVVVVVCSVFFFLYFFFVFFLNRVSCLGDRLFTLA